MKRIKPQVEGRKTLYNFAILDLKFIAFVLDIEPMIYGWNRWIDGQ